MPQDRNSSSDISLKAILLAGCMSLLALWWAWPRLKGRQAFHAASTEVQRMEPRELPDFYLDGKDGSLSASTLKGEWTLLFFAYSRCPDECIAGMESLASLHQAMKEGGHDRALRFVIVSVATDDDESQRIQDFAKAFDPAFTAYAGTWEERQKLFTFFESVIDGPNPYQHAANLFLIDPEAQYVATWAQIPEIATLRAQLCSFTNCSHATAEPGLP